MFVIAGLDPAIQTLFHIAEMGDSRVFALLARG